MRTIKESILGTTDSGQYKYLKKICNKILSKKSSLSNYNSELEVVDKYNNSIKEYDFGFFGQELIPCFITKIDKEISPSIKVYSALHKMEIQILPVNFVKVQSIENYLK
jgi:hypothetical protein